LKDDGGTTVKVQVDFEPVPGVNVKGTVTSCTDVIRY